LGDSIKGQKGGQVIRLLQYIFIPAIAGLLVWLGFANLLYGIGTAVFCLFSLIAINVKKGLNWHFLIYADQQGFMKNLKLSDKTVIFDGSNIYHFGLDHQVGGRALQLLVYKLRAEGFRLVCFFDANIYFTLKKNGMLKNKKGRFSIEILHRVFGLKQDEIYVVPSGIQADRFIVESLSQLPKSFAVTNDRYRGYEAEYDVLSRDKGWRKGVQMKQGKLLLYNYKFKYPLELHGP